MVDRFEKGLLMRSQPWVHKRFIRKGAGFSYAVLLALPTSLLLWALIIISVGK